MAGNLERLVNLKTTANSTLDLIFTVELRDAEGGGVCSVRLTADTISAAHLLSAVEMKYGPCSWGLTEIEPADDGGKCDVYEVDALYAPSVGGGASTETVYARNSQEAKFLARYTLSMNAANEASVERDQIAALFDEMDDHRIHYAQLADTAPMGHRDKNTRDALNMLNEVAAALARQGAPGENKELLDKTITMLRQCGIAPSDELLNAEHFFASLPVQHPVPARLKPK